MLNRAKKNYLDGFSVMTEQHISPSTYTSQSHIYSLCKNALLISVINPNGNSNSTAANMYAPLPSMVCTELHSCISSHKPLDCLLAQYRFSQKDEPIFYLLVYVYSR